MGIKSFVIRKAANFIASRYDKMAANSTLAQERVFKQLIKTGRKTLFGKDHQFESINSYEDFKKNVPLRDYESLSNYIDLILKGQQDVLWTGRPKYFAKTSGTTSGAKYIPLTKDSIPNHFGTARDALLNYISKEKKGDFLNGKMIFLSGSPELDNSGPILTGRLSGIVNHQVPAWLRTNQLPSYKTNCIEDWETKLEAIIDETINADMRLISGIPPWVQMYYERILERTGKDCILDVFPNLSMFVYGGVNYEPYRAKLEDLVGGKIDSVETYPASEGFIAFQDRQDNNGLLLNADSGIFFEFVEAGKIFDESPERLRLHDVQLGVNYAIIINNNAGLWGYNIGDTVEFVSLNPYRIKVTGRIKHFISAFGEHVIGKEVETALLTAASRNGIRIVEFSVAPQILPPEGGLPYHEWFIEFDNEPADLAAFSLEVDQLLQEQNIYYLDLISGNILQPLKIKALSRGAFVNYMKSIGKLGGQNKVPRLSNDRKLASKLELMVK